jgi:hypothetical protein
MVDKAIIESVATRISEVCSRGALIHVAENIPSYTIHAYNRVIEETGSVIGWADKENFILNFDHLSSCLEQALELFIKAKEGMLSFGLDEYVIQNMSPVLIINSLLSEKIEKSLIPSLANSHIYSAVALLELADFHEHCKPFLYNDLFPETIENLTKLTIAQSYLLVAQEATNKAYFIMYQANDFVRDKISTIDEVTFHLKIEERKSSEKYGGGLSPDRLLDFQKWALTKSKELWLVEIENKYPTTKIGAMAENLMSIFKKEKSSKFNDDQIRSILPVLETTKNYIRPIAKEFAPDALKGGRPKN